MVEVWWRGDTFYVQITSAERAELSDTLSNWFSTLILIIRLFDDGRRETVIMFQYISYPSKNSAREEASPFVPAGGIKRDRGQPIMTPSFQCQVADGVIFSL